MDVIKAKGYNIYIAKDEVEQINNFFSAKKYKESRCVIIVDTNTHIHCLDKILSEVDFFHGAEIVEVDPGESSKNIAVCENIWSLLLEYEMDKKMVVVNLGGGVITDMGGFTAALYKRGVGFVNIPTSLLAMVDASVGGKVGVNIEQYKNQVGTFYNPSAVFIRTDFLNTLDKRQINAGLVEMLKHGLIYDESHYKMLAQSIMKQKYNWTKLIHQSVLIKNTIVGLDPLEKSLRKSLNFGHTIGHAIESYLLEKGIDVLHGEAVLFGIVAELYLSKKILGFDLSSDILVALKKICVKKDVLIEFDALIKYLKADKKNLGGYVNFTLIESLGKCKIDNYVSIDIIEESVVYLNSWLKGI